MKWERARQSQNVEDRRGVGLGRGGGRMPVRGGGLGIGGIIIVVLIGWALGINPMQMLGLISEQQGGVPGLSVPAEQSPQSAPGAATGDDPFDQERAFVASILGDTEAGWGALFQQNAARQRGQRIEGDGGLLVRQELQADCYAGVWAHHAQARHQWLEPGDIEEALNTATAIGDDRLQQKSRGVVVPDSFSHGTSEQRVRWFKRGFESGQPGQCDTFGAATL